MKKALAFLLASIMCVASTACSNLSDKDKTSETKNDLSSKSSIDTEPDEDLFCDSNVTSYVDSIIDVSKYEKNDSESVISYYLKDSDNVEYNFDYIININGESLKLPAKCDDVESLGFVCTENLDENLDGVSNNNVWEYLDRDVVTFKNSSGQRIDFSICNTSDTSKSLSECTVYEVIADYELYKESPSITFSNGLSEESSFREFVEAFGEPTELSFSSDQMTAKFCYQDDSNKSLIIDFDINEIIYDGNNIERIDYTALIYWFIK